MENNANEDYSHSNRKLQDEPNKGQKIVNKGFPHYDKKEDSELDNSFNDDKTEQEGFIDDTDFGHITPRSYPNLDETKIDDSSSYEKENVDQKDTDFKEETSSDDDFYPNNEKNPEEQRIINSERNRKNIKGASR